MSKRKKKDYLFELRCNMQESKPKMFDNEEAEEVYYRLQL